MTADSKCSGEHNYLILSDPQDTAGTLLAFCTRCAKILLIQATGSKAGSVIKEK